MIVVNPSDFKAQKPQVLNFEFNKIIKIRISNFWFIEAKLFYLG